MDGIVANVIGQLTEHAETFGLVNDQRVFLPVGLQTDTFAQLVHRGQMLDPEAVDDTQKDVTLFPGALPRCRNGPRLPDMPRRRRLAASRRDRRGRDLRFRLLSAAGARLEWEERVVVFGHRFVVDVTALLAHIAVDDRFELFCDELVDLVGHIITRDDAASVPRRSLRGGGS